MKSRKKGGNTTTTTNHPEQKYALIAMLCSTPVLSQEREREREKTRADAFKQLFNRQETTIDRQDRRPRCEEEESPAAMKTKQQHHMTLSKRWVSAGKVTREDRQTSGRRRKVGIKGHKTTPTPTHCPS